jgi:hypothetical protein
VAASAPALLLLVLALCSQLAAAADIISSSKLESCIADGSQVGLAAAVAAAAALELKAATSPTDLSAFLQHDFLQIILQLSLRPGTALIQHIRTVYPAIASLQQDCCITLTAIYLFQLLAVLTRCFHHHCTGRCGCSLCPRAAMLPTLPAIRS